MSFYKGLYFGILGTSLVWLLINRFAIEPPAPYNHIPQENIEIYPYDKYFKVNVGKEMMFASFTDTNSMLPTMDAGHNAVQITEFTKEDIHIGDIIYFERKDGFKAVHRIIEIGNDGEWYCMTKGDNAPTNDIFKTRFDEIVSITIAIIY